MTLGGPNRVEKLENTWKIGVTQVFAQTNIRIDVFNYLKYVSTLKWYLNNHSLLLIICCEAFCKISNHIPETAGTFPLVLAPFDSVHNHFHGVMLDLST